MMYLAVVPSRPWVLAHMGALETITVSIPKTRVWYVVQVRIPKRRDKNF